MTDEHHLAGTTVFRPTWQVILACSCGRECSGFAMSQAEAQQNAYEALVKHFDLNQGPDR